MGGLFLSVNVALSVLSPIAGTQRTSGTCQERSFVCLHIRTPRFIDGEACREANLSSTVGPSGMSGCAMVVPQDDRLARAMHRGAMKVERP
jgi:hypothetical protein